MQFFELLVILCLVGVQAWFFMKTKQKIAGLSAIFPHLESTSVRTYGGMPALALDAEFPYSPTYRNIIDRLNNYLRKNAGASNDYGIMKEIVELEVHKEYEDASSSITMPLYVGLLGTFLGVALGLFLFSRETDNLLNAATSSAGDAVTVLLGNVAIAMVASFCGLLFTLVGRYQYSNTVTAVEGQFNAFLAFIQAELLPKATEDAEKSLRTFSQKIGEFASLLETFNSGMRSNLDLLDDRFSRAMSDARTAAIAQNQLFSRLSDMDTAKMVLQNTKLMKNMEQVLPAVESLVNRMISLDQVFDSAGYMIEQFNSFYKTEGEYADRLKQVYKFETDHGKLTSTLTGALSGYDQKVSMLLDRLEIKIQNGEITIDRLLEERAKNLRTLFERTEMQFSEYVDPGTAKDTFAALAMLPQKLEEVTKSQADIARTLQLLQAETKMLITSAQVLRSNETKSQKDLASAMQGLTAALNSSQGGQRQDKQSSIVKGNTSRRDSNDSRPAAKGSASEVISSDGKKRSWLPTLFWWRRKKVTDDVPERLDVAEQVTAVAPPLPPASNEKPTPEQSEN